MGDEKAKKKREKYTGIALEMDVIKKVAHQLERLPPTSVAGIVKFVQDWAERRPLLSGLPLESNGQLPLAAPTQDLKNGLGQGLGFPE